MTYLVPDICDDFPEEIRALACCPVKTEKRGEGQLNVPVSFAGVHFNPGQYLYADKNGIVVAPGKLDLEF